MIFDTWLTSGGIRQCDAFGGTFAVDVASEIVVEGVVVAFHCVSLPLDRFDTVQIDKWCNF